MLIYRTWPITIHYTKSPVNVFILFASVVSEVVILFCSGYRERIWFGSDLNMSHGAAKPDI